VGLLESKLALSCYVMVSIWMVPAVGQTVSEVAPSGTARAIALSSQDFHCHTGYPLAECQKDILHLRVILTRYPIEELGHWTWVLVPSQSWKGISRTLRLDPESPAFTALEPRETFLEEALFVHDPERTAELMREWDQSMPKLLELAVSHELGHALCAETNEATADYLGQQLRKGLATRCQIARDARKKGVIAGARHGLKPNAFREP
jgi:hypothetical protein